MTVDMTATRVLQSFRCPKYDKKCFLSLVKHSCWTAIFLGAIMLGLGLVLRSSLVNAPSPTVASSGLLFIVIGVFIICMGPFAAVYDLICREHRSNRTGIHAESGLSPNMSESFDLPSYSQVMTGLKTPSATYTMNFKQLSAKNLSESQPQPPSYEEIIGNHNPGSSLNIPESTQDVRRMTVP